MMTGRFCRVMVLLTPLLLSVPLSANEMFVAPAGSGNGSETNPFGSVQQAIDNAVAGDTITVLAGTYFEVLHSARNGAPGLRITLRAQTGAEVVIQLPVGALANARVLDVQHAYMTVEGIIFDGRYAGPQSDVIRVRSSGDFFTLRHSEVRNSGNNCLNLDTDAGAPIDGVIIENSLIHHCLNSTNERPDGHSDAHGISAGAVRGLIIRDTEIHTFSGDAVQFDADRDLPGWTDVLIERCRFWLQPLPEAVNDFAAGVVPGENAIDTKINPAVRAKLTLRDLTVYGFANSALNNGNIEALLLRENLDVMIDSVTVYDSVVAFRLRGPDIVHPGEPRITIQNAVVHDVREGFRYDGDIQQLRIYHGTIGANVSEAFHRITAGAIDVRNILLLGSSQPLEAPAAMGNRALDAGQFIDVATHNYLLTENSAAIDAGVELTQVTTDRAGRLRPREGGYDIGAYETCYSCIFDNGFD